jgi:hypothetical protein
MTKASKQQQNKETKHKKIHIDHNPREESSRSAFGEPKAKEHDPKDFKI